MPVHSITFCCDTYDFISAFDLETGTSPGHTRTSVVAPTRRATTNRPIRRRSRRLPTNILERLRTEYEEAAIVETGEAALFDSYSGASPTFGFAWHELAVFGLTFFTKPLVMLVVYTQYRIGTRRTHVTAAAVAVVLIVVVAALGTNAGTGMDFRLACWDGSKAGLTRRTAATGR